MAPRRKRTNAFRTSLTDVSDKENIYLRSLSDFQARIRRRETIRHGRNMAECDLERKVELEMKMREGSSRLLAAARHPRQTLEAAREHFTSNARMSAYLTELECRKSGAQGNDRCLTTSGTGTLSLSDLRFPLMWRDTDHFKNRGDHRRFAVFCLARIGTEIQDTSLQCPIDREQTDISFSDVLLFNNVPPEFQLTLEVYAHVLQEDLSIASAPRRIRRSIHSSISKTVGKTIAASLHEEFDEAAKKRAPRFYLVASSKLMLDDSDGDTRTHDLTLNNVENKQLMVPLFGHFCCRLAVQPDCISQDSCSGNVRLNDTSYWARLRGFSLEAWTTKPYMENDQNAIWTIPVTKHTTIEWAKSSRDALQIVNRTDHHAIENITGPSPEVVRLDSTEDIQNWFDQLSARVAEHTRWRHAAHGSQKVLCADSTSAVFINDKYHGSLYDETPLADPTSLTIKPKQNRDPKMNEAEYLFEKIRSKESAGSESSRASSVSNTRRHTVTGATLKSRWTSSAGHRR